MEGQISEYKCPACTGPLRFDGATGKLQCDYCGSTYSVAEIETMFASQDAEAAAAAQAGGSGDEWETTTQEWNEAGMKSYTCPSCGAELIFDETTAASECPYCGNPTMVPGQFAGTMKPEYIIPFKLDREKAVDSLKNYYKGKPFLPKAFTEDNRVEEIKGVYVPFWLYDGKAHAEGSYEGEKRETHTEGDFEVTTTEYYKIQRAGNIAFEKIPADASTKMPDDLMDSIEPYDYSELTDFSSAYLAGFMADKYDVTAEANAERATKRAKQSAVDAMKSDIRGYDSLHTVSENVSVKQGKASYAMMPVWMLNTKWNDQNYLFAMNGQSGRFVGALPTDKKKVALTFAGIVLLLEIIMGLVSVILQSEMSAGSIAFKFVLIPLAIAALVVLILKGKMNNVHLASDAAKYVTEGGMTFTRRRDIFIRRTVERTKIEKPEDNK